MRYPFKQKRLDENTLLREFSKDVDSEELVWHRDEQDRVVHVVMGEGWMFQRDNSVPIEICEGDTFRIRAEQYHRLIKGKSDLVVRIFEQPAVTEGTSRTYYTSGRSENRAIADKPPKAGPDKVAVVENDVDEDAFTYKVAKAALDDKKKVKIGGKEHPVKMSKKKAKEIVGEANKKSNHPGQYNAPEGSKRDKQLDASIADMKSDDPEKRARAFRRRERMEKKERSKPGFKNKPRPDTKKESVGDSALRAYIREILVEEILEEKKRKKAKKKRKSSGGGLSAATKETLKKKAQKRGLTPSSVYAEFRKGLAAWASSGSRKGMSQHQWAHARVNSANPSKSWAVVKKAKKRK